jgi:outer membrane receptor protein involved in Fe transport
MNKVHFGITSSGEKWTATLRGRWIDSRRTVDSNPVGRVPSYGTLDGLVRCDLARGVSIALNVTNATDRTYAEPGVRDANAGTQPGGSGGYFNSLLPQPGRQVLLMLEITSSTRRPGP